MLPTTSVARLVNADEGEPLTATIMEIWVGIRVDETPNWNALARTLVIRMMRVPGSSGSIDRHAIPCDGVDAVLIALEDVEVAGDAVIGSRPCQWRQCPAGVHAGDGAVGIVDCQAGQLRLRIGRPRRWLTAG